jgi:predicted porin
MKTKQMVLGAAIAATVCGNVWAQTNVTVYGIVDAGIVRESGGAAGNVTKLGSGIASGSRLGFRGIEDLGGGANAHFVLETGANIDTGALGQGGLLFGRQAFVGITGASTGSINFGRQYTPLFLAINAIDPFLGASMAGTANNIVSEGGIRMNNTVKYTSPRLGGFVAEAAYGLGEVVGDNRAGRNIGALAGYTNGPVAIRLAYHHTDNVPSATVTADSGRTTFLGGTYNFGIAKAALAYAVNKGLVTINSAAQANTDSRDVLAGVTIPFGPNTIMVSYILKDDRSRQDRDAKQIAVGYTYAVSKRTDFYTSYARIRNDAPAGKPGFYTVGNGSDTGTGDKAFNFGVRHTF